MLLSLNNLGYWDQFDGGIKFSAYITNAKVQTGPLDLVFDNVVINNGNGYDSKSGLFRAPSNGIYSFQFSGQQYETTNRSFFTMNIKKNGGFVFNIEDTPSNSDHYGNRNNVNYHWEFELKDGDTINLELYEGSTLYTHNTNFRMYFSGQLISHT